MLEGHLAQAERHIVQGEEHIRGQHQIICDLQASGHDVSIAIDVLVHFEENAIGAYGRPRQTTTNAWSASLTRNVGRARCSGNFSLFPVVSIRENSLPVRGLEFPGRVHRFSPLNPGSPSATKILYPVHGIA